MSAINYEEFAAGFFKIVSKQGSEWNAVCPWHADSSPSCRVNVEKGLYVCLGCHQKGSLKTLAKENGVRVDPTAIDVLSYVLRAVTNERPEPTMAAAYLTPLMMTTDYWTNVRHLSDDVITQFQLGQDIARNTATIPLRSEGGKLLGVIERQLGSGGGPKYHYPYGYQRNKHLFGAWMLDDDADKVCIVEGPVDALAMWDAGIPAVAISGSSMSETQARLLRRLDVRHVVIFTDQDAAGDHACNDVVNLLDGTGVLWSVAQYRKGWGKDPAALSIAQRRRAFDTAKPHTMFPIA